MAPRRKEEVERALDFEESYRELAETMGRFHISRISEMPRVELYRDQIISLVTSELAPLYDDSEKVVTGSMINNYVKQRIVPAPARKRYTRRHLGTIVLVCAFKRVLPIAQVAQLITLCARSSTDDVLVYDSAADALEEALAVRFPLTGPQDAARPPVTLDFSGASASPLPDHLRALLESTISQLADKVYVERTLALERLREEA